MNIINLNGGLGNQLFQYSFGMAMKYQYDIDIKFCDKFINPNQLRIQDIFDLDVPKAISKDFEKTVGKLFLNDRFRNYFLRIIKKLGISNLQNFIIENYKHPLNHLPNLNDKFFFGYWQNFNFFYSHINKIKNVLKFKHPLEKSNEIFDLTNSYSNIVCLHVRLGDYKTAKNLKIFSEIPLDYYYSAISKLKKKLEKPLFILFSDQLNKAINMFDGINYIFPSTKFNSTPKNDFQLMSMCDSYIFSNSTFSLWSAYLSKKQKIYFTRPTNWYKNFLIENNNKYYPADWINLN